MCYRLGAVMRNIPTNRKSARTGLMADSWAPWRHGLVLLLLLASLMTSSVVTSASATLTTPEESNGRNGGTGGSGTIVAKFRGDLLQHLVVDKHSGLVYVGDVNMLYQLGADLERQVVVKTGPRMDYTGCPAGDCDSSHLKRMTDNVNKALVIDYTDTRLIACGSLFQGKKNPNYPPINNPPLPRILEKSLSIPVRMKMQHQLLGHIHDGCASSARDSTSETDSERSRKIHLLESHFLVT